MVEPTALASCCGLRQLRLPEELVGDGPRFEQLWALHPEDVGNIKFYGQTHRMPRYQQVYGADYHYTGSRHLALPLPAEFEPFLAWARDQIEPRLNGTVVNWYDANLGHYIGRHRDSVHRMIVGAPIVMVSLGAERVLRMRPWEGQGFEDVRLPPGQVIVLSYDANLAWTHEVPLRRCDTGRRISITLRAFET